MKEKEFRKLVKEEIKKILYEDVDIKSNPNNINKESILSQIYQWIIRGDMDKAAKAMQNDPTLVKLANNIDALKKELVRRMENDKATYDLFANAIETIKKRRGIK